MVVVLVLLVVLLIGVGAIVALKRRFSYDPEAAVLTLPGLSTEDGLRTLDIAAAISDDEPATQRTLQKLASSGHVEAVPGGGPQRWRLTAAYRSLVNLSDPRQRDG